MSSSLPNPLPAPPSPTSDQGPLNFKVTHPNQKLARRLRFPSPPSYSTLSSKIVSLWGSAAVLSGSVLHLSYLDKDGDRILLSSEEELQAFYGEWRESKDGEVVKMRVVVEGGGGGKKDKKEERGEVKVENGMATGEDKKEENLNIENNGLQPTGEPPFYSTINQLRQDDVNLSAMLVSAFARAEAQEVEESDSSMPDLLPVSGGGRKRVVKKTQQQIEAALKAKARSDSDSDFMPQLVAIPKKGGQKAAATSTPAPVVKKAPVVAPAAPPTPATPLVAPTPTPVAATPPSLLADLTEAFIQFTTSPAFTSILDRVAQGAYSPSSGVAVVENKNKKDEQTDLLIAARLREFTQREIARAVAFPDSSSTLQQGAANPPIVQPIGTKPAASSSSSWSPFQQQQPGRVNLNLDELLGGVGGDFGYTSDHEERAPEYHYGDPDPDPEPVSFEERRVNETTTTQLQPRVASAYSGGEDGKFGGRSIVGGGGGSPVGVGGIGRGGGFARFSNGAGGGATSTGQEHLPPHQQSSVFRPPSTSYLGMPGQEHIPLHQQSSGPPVRLPSQFGQLLQQQQSSSSSNTPSTREGSLVWVESPNAPLVDVSPDSESDSDGPPLLVGVPAKSSQTSSKKKKTVVLAMDSDSDSDSDASGPPALVASNTDPRVVKGSKKIQPPSSSPTTNLPPPPPTATTAPPPRAGNRFSPPPGPPPLFAGFPSSFSAGPQTSNYNPPKGTYPVTDPNTIYSPTGVYTNIPDYQYPTFPPSDVLYPFDNSNNNATRGSFNTSALLTPTHPFTSPARTATYVFRSTTEGGPRKWIPCDDNDDLPHPTQQEQQPNPGLFGSAPVHYIHSSDFACASEPAPPPRRRVDPTTTLYRTFGDTRSSARSELARAREEARYGRCAGKLKEMGFEEVKFGEALRDALAASAIREKSEEEIVVEVVRELIGVGAAEEE